MTSSSSIIKAGLLSLALGMPLLSLNADNYVIYPIPQSMTMNSGRLVLTSQVKVVYESGIDQATRNRLEALLDQHGIEVTTDTDESSHPVIRLGIVSSGEAVEKHALEVVGLKTPRIMAAGKFDRHAISVGSQGITILGEHTNAVFCGLASLEQMMEQMQDGSMEYATIYDHADQQNRGLVEGYYGYPYSVEVKKDLMRYMMRYKMNTYMYGAKSDPYHSQMWKDAYPTSISGEQEKNGWLTQKMIKDISRVSQETKVNFIWAIHPGNDFIGSSTAINDIMGKFQKMHALGVRQFGVFVDDVGIPSTDADMKKNADRLSELQTAIEHKWNTSGAVATDTVRPLHFVPQIYCNSFASSTEQRQKFMTALSKVQSYITVYSTGQGVWSVPNNSHTTTIVNEFGRPMGWWWNYPCNDNADGQIYPMDMYSNFVDMPAIGNGERLPSALNQCQGIVANPMQQGQVAKTSLFSIADYAWNNTAFNNGQSWEASFQGLIRDEEVRRAYHDITYYLRWNDPQSLQTLINGYKNSLEGGGTQASGELKATMQKIKADCELVMKLRDSRTQSDNLLYTDIAPWLQTLHTYTIVTEKMLDILDTPTDAKKSQWQNVKEVSDSLDALEHSTLYTAYALEGMGNSISVSKRQAQLSRVHWFPFLSYLRSKAIDPYFDDAYAITQPMAISNSPLLKASVTAQDGTIRLAMKASDLDVNKYVGIALPGPIMIENITLADRLVPLARYSVNGREWKKITSPDELIQKHIAYLVFLNEDGHGIKDFALNEGDVSISLPTQAQVSKVTLPQGNIYDKHTGDMMVDGDYNTYTCLNRNQTQGDSYTLDLGKSVSIHDVRLCLGLTNGDHPTACIVQVSGNGTTWTTLKVNGTTTTNWNIDLKQNVYYNNNMVYCDFDAAGRKARYIRLYLNKPNTNKWLRIYEMEINRQYAENSAMAACTDSNGNEIKELTDGNAITGLPAKATSPLTYSFNRINKVRTITFYGLPNGVQPTISITANGSDWQNIGTLTEACQTIDLQAYPDVRAVRLEWQGDKAPAIFEIMPEYDPSTSSLPIGGSGLEEAFADLKSQALNALDSCGQGEKLITGNSQFSSPYTESLEGSLNNLLDGKLNTFWHSAWSGGGTVPDGLHYLEIALPEDTQGDVIMHYGRRSTANTHQLVKARIQGVVSGSGTSAQTEDIIDLDLPYKSNTETLVRRFNLPKVYPAIRLLELKTTGTNGNNSAGFFHVGEMQVYGTDKYYILHDAQTEADALLAATAPMPSEATESDMKRLQSAYEAFMHKVFDIPVDINNIQGNDSSNGMNSIHDMSGRRISRPTHGGVYIVNGKKTILTVH